MTKYLVLYRLAADAPDPMAETDPDIRTAGMRQWREWFETAGPALVDPGGPTVPADASPDATGTRISGFSILDVASSDELDRLLATHPHARSGSFDVHVAASAPPPGH